MKDLKDILDRNRPVSEIIEDLKCKSVNPPSWEMLRKILIPNEHEILEDKQMRRDRTIQTDSGTFVEKASRTTLALEKLLAKRVNQFTFTIPVKREYSNIDTPQRQEIANAIEKIYQEADIDTINIERGSAYFMACEIFSLWYSVPKENTIYGFKSDYKLRCRTFSPMKDNVELYPLMDEYGDLLAFSLYYEKKVKDETISFFETFTADRRYKWHKGEESDWIDDIVSVNQNGETEYGDEIILEKIPGIYGWRETPVFEEGTPYLRKDAEYKHSEDSDIIAYNVAPLVKVVGKMISDEKKYESRRLIRVENGGDVSYVSWNQATEATDKHIQRDIDWFWMFNQMPDVSFKNLQSLGNIGYDARQMMLTDAFLRIGEESKPLIQFFRRECNVIKAYLKKMQNKWSDEDIDAVTVKHVITPYIPKDEKYEIEKRQLANGGKALESQRESIQRWGKSPDVDGTLQEMKEEAAEEQETKLSSIMEGAI